MSFDPNADTPDLTSHFGVYAFALNDARDAVLLIKKTLGCYTGLYDLPGGTMEPHELLEQTLQREVFEETDCAITDAEQLGTFSVLYPHMHKGRQKVLRHIGTIYLADVSGTPRTEGSGLDDSGGCVWLPLSDISDENATPFVVMSLRAYLENA